MFLNGIQIPLGETFPQIPSLPRQCRPLRGSVLTRAGTGEACAWRGAAHGGSSRPRGKMLRGTLSKTHRYLQTSDCSRDPSRGAASAFGAGSGAGIRWDFSPWPIGSGRALAAERVGSRTGMCCCRCPGSRARARGRIPQPCLRHCTDYLCARRGSPAGTAGRCCGGRPPASLLRSRPAGPAPRPLGDFLRPRTPNCTISSQPIAGSCSRSAAFEARFPGAAAAKGERRLGGL